MSEAPKTQIRTAGFGKKKRAASGTNPAPATPQDAPAVDPSERGGVASGRGVAEPARASDPARADAQPTPAATSKPAPAAADAPAKSAERTKPAKAKSSTPAFTDKRKQQVTVYLSLDVATRARERGHAERLTNGDVVMNALEGATFASLTQEPELRGGLFKRPASAVAENPQRGTKVQFTFTWLPEHVKVLDDLVKQYQAPNSSQLVEVALTEYLAA